MKRIPLRQFNKFDSRVFLIDLVSFATPDRGLSLKDVRCANRVIDKLEKAGSDHVDLEDSDWEYLKKQVESASYTRASMGIERSADDVINAEAV